MPRPSWPTSSIHRRKTATAAAVVIHVAGAIGILLQAEWFVRMTPVNLLVMLVLTGWTEEQTPTRHLIGFFAAAWVTGMASEMIGTNTGLLFGNYTYGPVLGPALLGVPLLIGCNWFLILRASSGVSARLLAVLPARAALPNHLAAPTLGALLATGFDAVMEPVAVRLGYWTWLDDGSIPALNYLTWFGVAWLLLFLGARLQLSDENPFPTRLYLIQLLFFLVLRWQA